MACLLECNVSGSISSALVLWVGLGKHWGSFGRESDLLNDIAFLSIVSLYITDIFACFLYLMCCSLALVASISMFMELLWNFTAIVPSNIGELYVINKGNMSSCCASHITIFTMWLKLPVSELLFIINCEVFTSLFYI